MNWLSKCFDDRPQCLSRAAVVDASDPCSLVAATVAAVASSLPFGGQVVKNTPTHSDHKRARIGAPITRGAHLGGHGPIPGRTGRRLMASGRPERAPGDVVRLILKIGRFPF